MILLLGAVLCLTTGAHKAPSNVAELFVTAENLHIVRQPDKVDACVLRYIAPPKGGSMQEERYEETDFLVVPTDVVSALQTALLKETTYGWDSVKLCWPRYHTRLRFHRSGKIVAIDFCFSCDILLIKRDGEPISGEDFRDPVFIESMRKLFPEDPALKKVR
ncbi:MAG: hypothetical protein V4773_17120 [Verrucomicrobiota bacterium]